MSQVRIIFSHLLELAASGDEVGLLAYDLSPEADSVLRQLASTDREIRRMQTRIAELEGLEGELSRRMEELLESAVAA